MKNISPQEAKSLISQNSSNLIILDVRTPAENKEGHIANSINIDYHSPSFESQIANLDPQKNYLVYCRSGGRSAGSCELMEKKGIKNVYNLAGGFINWQLQSHA